MNTIYVLNDCNPLYYEKKMLICNLRASILLIYIVIVTFNSQYCIE